MLLAIAITTVLSQAAVPVPAEFAGEASLGEIVQHIEKAADVKVKLSENLAKRPIYFHWVDQPVEDVLKGLSFALDLKLTKTEDLVEWTLRAEDRSNGPRDEIIRDIESLMAFRFRLLASSQEEISLLHQNAQDRWSASKKTEVEAYRELGAITSLERERPLIRIMARLGKVDHLSHFFGKEAPSNCIVLDASQHPELGEIIPYDTLRPDTQFNGEPMFLLIPVRGSGHFEYQLVKCYSNTQIRLASITFFLGESWEKGFEPDKSPIFQKPIKAVIPFKIRMGNSFEILPPAFGQLNSSFAVWCPTDYQGMWWGRLPETFTLSYLMETRPITKRRDSPEPQKYAKSFLHQAGWSKVLYSEFPKPEPEANWTKLLPFLRKLRKNEITIIELADYVSKLSSKELTEMARASVERGDLPVTDIEFLDALYLIKAVSTRKSDLISLTGESKVVEIPYGKLSLASRNAITDYLATPRFWPLYTYMQHPGFKDIIGEASIELQLTKVDGKSELGIAIKGLETHASYHSIPVAGTP